jgi:hypothetical protein
MKKKVEGNYLKLIASFSKITYLYFIRGREIY